MPFRYHHEADQRGLHGELGPVPPVDFEIERWVLQPAERCVAIPVLVGADPVKPFVCPGSTEWAVPSSLVQGVRAGAVMG